MTTITITIPEKVTDKQLEDFTQNIFDAINMEDVPAKIENNQSKHVMFAPSFETEERYF